MEEKRGLFGALTVYRERGAYLRRLEQFDKAKASYDEAFENAPEDVRTLTGRSQVCSDAVQPIQAYTDAYLALKLAPKNMVAWNMQARAMYAMSDFERSVVINYRGSRYRREPPYFIEGINQGVETIQDCIGLNAGNVMVDFLPLIKRSAVAVVDEDEPTEQLHVSRIPRPAKKVKLTQMEARKHATLARVLAMKYLGPMAYDKFFVQQLKDDARLQSANSKGSNEMKTLVTDAHKSLNDRQDMLRAQRPYYTFKLAEKSVSKYQIKYKAAVLAKERETGVREAERLLKIIEQSLQAKRIATVMSYAYRLQTYLDTKTPRTLPDKQIFMDRLYRAVGEAYLCQHRLSYRMSERGNRRRIAFLMGLQVGRPTSFDSVLANYPYKFADTKKALSKLSDLLEMCENSTMRCWLMYEIAKLLSSQKNHPLAKFYAKRCQRVAQEISNPVWWLNGLFILLSTDMTQGNANEVRIQVEEAIEYSKKLQDPEEVQCFLRKCSEMMAEAGGADDRKAVLQREKAILGVMDENVRVNTQVLFKRMSTIPPGRRFTVIQQPQPGTELQSVRARLRQKGLSVIPGPERALAPPPKSDTRGFQKFDL